MSDENMKPEELPIEVDGAYEGDILITNPEGDYEPVEVVKPTIVDVLKEKALFWFPPIVISWMLWFAGIFATFLLSAAKTNLDNGIIPPLTFGDAVNALWAAIGAAIAVAIQYLDKKYTRYGVNASNADDIEMPTVSEAPDFSTER